MAASAQFRVLRILSADDESQRVQDHILEFALLALVAQPLRGCPQISIFLLAAAITFDLDVLESFEAARVHISADWANNKEQCSHSLMTLSLSVLTLSILRLIASDSSNNACISPPKRRLSALLTA